MLDGSMIIPIILNILIVSIPEETYFVVLSLILMKRFDIFDRKKANVLKLAVIVVFVAVSSTVLRLFSILDGSTTLIYGILSIFVLIVLLFGIKSPNGILKAFLSVCAAFLIAMAMELLVYPAMAAVPGFSAEGVNKPGWMTIVLSIPERVMQIILITMLFLRRRSFMKLGFFKVITRNKLLAYISGGLVVFNFIFVYIMFRLIFLNNILAVMDSVVQVLIVALVIIFPLLNMSVLLGVINYSVNKYTYNQVYFQEEVKVLRVVVHMLMQQRRYGEVDLQMASFIDEIKKIK